MTVNANIHANFKGIGIHSNNHENVSEIKNEVYEIEREFDLYVKDLLIESSSKMSLSYQDRANNIINLILPFDVENAVKYNANYLKGNFLEIRDLNYKELEKNVDTKFKNISRTLLRRDRIYYDKGVTYNNEDIKIIGTKWLTIYVPVYIYSFLEIKNNNKYLHYIAVNARTNKTMGSIATDDVKVKKSANMLILFILIIFLFMIPFLLFAFLSLFDFESEINFKLVLLFGLLLVFLFSLLLGISIHKIKLFVQKETIKKLKKENKKFDYEKLTNKSFSNIQKKDKRIK